MAGKRGHRSLGCAPADTLWAERVEEVQERRRWREERRYEELFERSHQQAHKAERCEHCGQPSEYLRRGFIYGKGTCPRCRTELWDVMLSCGPEPVKDEP